MNNVLFIDPGQLTSELALEAMQPIADGMGGYDESWDEIGMVWGRIEPVSTSQKDFGARPRPEVTHRILLRFRPDLSSAMRLRKGGRIFSLRSVHDPDESGRYLICLATEQGR
ncbi:SPP1 family predicted phage head-tail adaptor [Ochrobactrum daejeonense]|uniref:SPP1 family predicted phage head-tail adaptor n=1 Tax=Brucella daejeonensis TaxID=659015 RepID=A0A7W9EPE0_9HYPH|nr:phage head closure protein [Brucella daejeonensis]MBB5703711.1 SPP1 family predicted phage head-tail adaptor [Brucella daejeonensis]NKB78759.1 phage head closure protein [Brucella daejeonensis]